MLRKPGDKACLADALPHPPAPLNIVAMLLFLAHVRPADPVLVLCLALQLLHHVALHLPGDGPRSPVFADPLLARDALPQEGHCQKHGEVWFVTQLQLSYP